MRILIRINIRILHVVTSADPHYTPGRIGTMRRQNLHAAKRKLTGTKRPLSGQNGKKAKGKRGETSCYLSGFQSDRMLLARYQSTMTAYLR